MPKAPHHSGTHQRRAARLKARADADPTTRCWRCGKTLADHAPHRNGKPATWTAGHPDGYEGVPDAPLLPEASTCNYSHGATYGNRQRKRRTLRPTRDW
jgi:hypothetical protein